MVTTQGQIDVGTTSVQLDTTIVTQSTSDGGLGGTVHREAVVVTDPATNANRVRVSPLGASRANTVVGHAEIADDVDGYRAVHKFGSNAAVGTTLAVLCTDGIYRMPQAANGAKLRVKAGNANDTAAGSGAREITIIGLDTTGARVTEALATAGASAGSDSANTYMRLFRAYVSASGTYPLAVTTNSQAADVVIENAAGTEDWMTILDGFAQSQFGCYTVPLGQTAYMYSFWATVDSNKAFDLSFCVRQDILDSAAPYSGLRIQNHMVGLKEPFNPSFQIPAGPFPALTDMTWSAKVTAGTAAIAVDFEMLLKDD